MKIKAGTHPLRQRETSLLKAGFPPEKKSTLQAEGDAGRDRLDLSLKQAEEKPGELKKWTVLAYLGADNNLGTAQMANMQRMSAAGSGPEVNIAAQLDVKGGGASRFKLGKSRSVPQLVKRFGPTDSGDPKVFEDFLKWGIKNYPAQNYLIVIGSHGGGIKGVIQDDTSDSLMPIPDFKQALKTAEKAGGVDKSQVNLLFDACLMGQTEVAYEFQEVADTMIASEQSIISASFPYRSLIAQLASQEPQQTLESIPGMVNSLKVPNIALLKLNKMPGVKKSVEKLAAALLKTPAPPQAVKEIITRDTRNFSVARGRKPYMNFIDLYDLAEKLKNSPEIQDKKLKSAAASVMKAVDKAVVERQSSSDAHGLSIYASGDQADYEEFKYARLAFAQDSLWPKAMKKFAG